jgi:hypothetical protein
MWIADRQRWKHQQTPTPVYFYRAPSMCVGLHETVNNLT